MKAETFIVRNPDDLAPCLAWLKERLPDAPLEVKVSTKTRSRSVQQNRLMWLWNTQIAEHLGLFKDEVHEMLKRKFAVPIFERDDAEYAEMVETVRQVWRSGMKDEAEGLMDKIARLTSTTDFCVDEMSEYLHNIEIFAAETGARLTFPDDLYSSK